MQEIDEHNKLKTGAKGMKRQLTEYMCHLDMKDAQLIQLGVRDA